MARFRALLLGVAEFHQSVPPLPFIPDDLQMLGDALRAADYDVTIYSESKATTLNAIHQHVEEFIGNAVHGDTTLIYLSSHGLHYEGVDYLIPGDARIDLKRFLPQKSCVAINDWDAAISTSQGDNLVIFVDACREGVSLTKTMSTKAVRSWGNGKLRKYGSKKVAYVYSCGPGQRAAYVDVPPESFSLFARALVNAIGNPTGPATLKGLVDTVYDDVLRLAHKYGKPENQEVHLRSGAHDVKAAEFALFTGETRKDPSGRHFTRPKKPLWKRTGVRIAAAVAALALVASGAVFGWKQWGPTPPADPVHLVFDTWGKQSNDMHGYSELFAEYTKRHPHITIEQRWASTLEEHADNVQARLRAGAGLGDVVAAEEAIMGDMYVRPADWADLRPLVGDLSKDYVASRWDGGQTPDGKRLLGLPTDVQTMAMCYRRDLLTAAGLPTEREAVAKLWPTWGAFVATAKQYKERTGLPMLDTVRHVFSAMALQGGEPLFYDRSNVFAADRSNSVRSAWDGAVQMIDAGITAKAPTYTKDWTQGLSSNAFAVTLCPNWILQLLAEQSGPGLKGQWDLTALPGGSAHWGGSWLSVPAQSKHQAEAAALAVFLTSREGQLAAFAKQPGVFPAHLGAIQSDQVKNLTNPYFNNAPTAQIYTAAAVTIRPVFLGCRYTTIMEKAFVHAIGQVESTGGNIAQLWEQAQNDARRFRC